VTQVTGAGEWSEGEAQSSNAGRLDPKNDAAVAFRRTWSFQKPENRLLAESRPTRVRVAPKSVWG
jgi:hypothetical protein